MSNGGANMATAVAKTNIRILRIIVRNMRILSDLGWLCLKPDGQWRILTDTT